ncbi:type II toxin-antitoxin system death-on-curing family toxin [Psychroflexus sp. CAK57W]|uniref:RhuM family protein n=1 Tax=Psychroflexus curvus TaxID=2873595 RepID=UPI001CCF52AB|nr:RhuM family protein [Psychroflexus curvus]MBZ9786905.1 type II toxin-antitoxin system death-on-curing family toxin [Psychroflexus curvus]
MKSHVEIFKSKDDQVELKVRLDEDTVWLNRHEISVLFDRDVKTIGKHINNVFDDGELLKSSTVAKFATVQKEGKREVLRDVEYFNLDVIISVGYRIKSHRGVQFRQWATQRLRDYIVQGYALNQKQLELNKTQFLNTLENLKILSKNSIEVEAKDVLSLIQTFSDTFFALESYDKDNFPNQGTQNEIKTSAAELSQGLRELKDNLIKRGEASELFGKEKREGSLEGIFCSVFQSVFGDDAYPNIEEKAAHLMYFIIKNHPFIDGNKRSGAFSFVWILQKAGYKFEDRISPETLTTLTLLIAESDPTDKEKMIGIIKLVLSF